MIRIPRTAATTATRHFSRQPWNPRTGSRSNVAGLLTLGARPEMNVNVGQQRRMLFNWLFNPKEEVVPPKELQPLKLNEAAPRLLYWDASHMTPNLKPEFNDRIVSSHSTGIGHSCAIVDGHIHAWGSNYYSQVGLTTDSFHDDDTEEITDVHFINQLASEEITQVASGSYHNLALSNTGKLWSWGSAILGKGDEVYDSLPQPIEFFHALGRDIKQVFASGAYSMALVTPKNSTSDYDDELYIWGYLPFENGHDGIQKSLRPLLVTNVLGYKISHVACSPWHFTIAATEPAEPSTESTSAETTDGSETITQQPKPTLMTFGRYFSHPDHETPYGPMYLDLAPVDEFFTLSPWRKFRSVSANSELVIKKIVAAKGFDIVLMENGSIGVSDHDDHVARLIHRPLKRKIVDVAAGANEVVAVLEGRVIAWKTPSAADDEVDDDDTAVVAEAVVAVGIQKDEQDLTAFFNSRRTTNHQARNKPPASLAQAMFEPSVLILEKPGLSKCSAQYQRFTIS